jgi:hypothetical protein
VGAGDGYLYGRVGEADWEFEVTKEIQGLDFDVPLRAVQSTAKFPGYLIGYG